MVSIVARENRVMVNSIKKDIGEIKIEMKNISNHYSRRLPVSVTLLITILSSLCVGLITWGLK